MAFSPSLLETLRRRCGLFETVARRVQLKRRGGEYWGLCPFHREKTPSFSLNESKGFYYCFGCGAHGDVFTFVMASEGVDFGEAVRRLADAAGLPLERETAEDKRQRQRQDSLGDALEHACRWFEQRLNGEDGRRAREFLAGRAFDTGVTQRFRLGFAPADGRRLALELAAAGRKTETLREAGLTVARETAATPLCRYRNRLVFPIGDAKGRIVGFGGRALDDTPPKYLNSPQSEIFHKKRLLYGWRQAEEAMRRKNTAIVVEGYMDVLALHKGGFAHSVATLGTALSEYHLRALWRYAPEPVLCFDGDAAGLAACRRAARNALPLLAPGNSLRFATLPAGEDPDSLLRAGHSDAFNDAIDGAAPLFELLWRDATAAASLDTPERRSALRSRLQRLADSVAHPQVRRDYHDMFRQRLFTLFRLPSRHGRKPQAGATPATLDSPQLARARKLRMFHRLFLATLIRHPSLIEDFAEDAMRLDFTAVSRDLEPLRQALVAAEPENMTSADTLMSALARKGVDETARACLASAALHTPQTSPKAEVEEARLELQRRVRELDHEALRAQALAARKAKATHGEGHDKHVQLLNRLRLESEAGLRDDARQRWEAM